jgi:thiamine monophosphate synthase
VVGVTALRDAHERARMAKVPLVAIGGITVERAQELVGLADCVAVIGALVPSAQSALQTRRARTDALRDVTARARAFQELFGIPLARDVAR